MSSSTTAKVNGCHSQPRPTRDSGYVAQSGWSATFYDGYGVPQRVPIYVKIKHVLSTDCQYDKSENDPCVSAVRTLTLNR